MLCSLTVVGTRPWNTTYHTESTAYAKNAWDKFLHTKCRLIDGNTSMVLTLLHTGFLPARTFNVAYTRLL